VQIHEATIDEKSVAPTCDAAPTYFIEAMRGETNSQS